MNEIQHGGQATFETQLATIIDSYYDVEDPMVLLQRKLIANRLTKVWKTLDEDVDIRLKLKNAVREMGRGESFVQIDGFKLEDTVTYTKNVYDNCGHPELWMINTLMKVLAERKTSIEKQLQAIPEAKCYKDFSGKESSIGGNQAYVETGEFVELISTLLTQYPLVAGETCQTFRPVKEQTTGIKVTSLKKASRG